MAWTERNALDQRNEFIACWIKGDLSIAELSRAFQVARKTAYKWIGRYDAEGRPGLQDRSRAPQHSPQSLDERTVKAILEVRRKHPTWGPLKIRQRLGLE